MSTKPKTREERDALCAQLDGIRDALGNGAIEELWPPGLTLPEAVRELVESRARFKRAYLSKQHAEPAQQTAGKGMDNPSHYNFTITPIDAIEAWDLNFSRGCVVKYIARAPHKGTELDDLVKARDYLDREIARVRARG